MTQRNQKDWEKFHLELLCQLQPELLPGMPVPADPPAPDALVCLSGRTIGIELTTFLWDAADPGGSASRALHSLRTRVVEHSKLLWESRRLPAVDVGLIWNHHQSLSGSEVTSLAGQLVDLVSRHVPDIDAHLTIAHPAPGWEELPKHATAVFVARPTWLAASIWDFAQAGSVPHLRDTFAHIQHILDDKEPKIYSYRKRCDEVHLLIVADATTTQSLVDIDDEEVPTEYLVSSFDGAYLLSAIHRRLVKLSLSRP